MKIGILGATSNKTKYGYKVLKNLKNRDLGELYPINPKYDEIEGVKCYKRLKDIPSSLDLLVFIVPPSSGLSALKDVVEKGVQNLWFQPGAESKEIEEFCKEHNLNYSFYRCIMVSDKDEIEAFIEK